ncbi:MAG: metallophosphoesterase [Alphaproteobacteria bacterium]|nr:metallophosphoesterase [Alphaproteobacteria bacterium]
MRVVHATDIHWFQAPGFGRLSPKRLIGSANLYLRGRRHHFDPVVQAALVDAMAAQQPDVVLITGDLTATALEQEFEIAHAALEPLLTAVPSLVLLGNHDVYTRGAHRTQRLSRWFGPWQHLGPDGLGHLRVPGLTLVGLDPNRPHALASGMIPPEQLAALPAALDAAPADDAVLLALHYPVLDRDGRVYDGWEHGLRNARALIDVLRLAPRKPDLITHGHIHHGFRVDLPLGEVQVPICNPGSGGYAWLQARDRAACFNAYTFEAGRLTAIERFRYGADGFTAEPGGAYATGR